jgi:hypothetical protein
MPRVATKLTTNRDGSFGARKRIPVDVQKAYAKLYGNCSEERFNSGRVTAVLARAKEREWRSEISAQGFLDFVHASGKGPLFYNAYKTPQMHVFRPGIRTPFSG